jgi:hypothetical protein
MMLGAAATQMLFEFGPLWLVAAAVPTVVFGPYTAGMTSTLGLGGVVAGRLPLGRVPAAATGGDDVGALRDHPHLESRRVDSYRSSGRTARAARDDRDPSLAIAASARTVSDAIQRFVGHRNAVVALTFLPCSLLFGALSDHGGNRGRGVDRHRCGGHRGHHAYSCQPTERALSGPTVSVAGAPPRGQLDLTWTTTRLPRRHLP